MPTANNKVNFGLENVYYSVITDDGSGNVTFGTPARILGAVDLNLEQQGEMTPFAADNNGFYWVSSSNNGYSGTLEVANIPDAFRTDVLGELSDTAGAIYEKADVETKEFALLFEIKGDVRKARHIMYRCKAQRPAVHGHTTEASTTPQTDTLNITAMPLLSNQVVKAKCKEGDSCYANWFTEVHEIA